MFFPITLQYVTVDLNCNLYFLSVYCIIQNPPSRLQYRSTRFLLTLLARALALLTDDFLVFLSHSRLVVGEYVHYRKTPSFQIISYTLSHQPFAQYRTGLNKSQVPGHHGTYIVCRGA
jgi:hypothetical protein